MSLSSLFIESQKVKYGEIDIEIKDISLKDLPLIAPLVEKFLKGEQSTQEKVLSLIKEDSETVARLIINLTSIPPEKVKDLRLDVLVFLIAKIIEINVVFIKKNIPKIQEISKEISERIGQA